MTTQFIYYFFVVAVVVDKLNLLLSCDIKFAATFRLFPCCPVVADKISPVKT
jgi:hypothetical protein